MEDCAHAAELVEQFRMGGNVRRVDLLRAAKHIRECSEFSCQEIKRTFTGHPSVLPIVKA